MDRRLIKQLEGAIPPTQWTQRNWDLDKDIDEEHLKLFKLALSHSPSSFNNPYFRVHFIKNRELIEKIYDYSEGSGPKRNTNPDEVNLQEDVSPKQTQILANLLVLFERNSEYFKRHRDEYDTYRGEEFSEYRDRNLAVGSAVGYLTLICSLLGYKTGEWICDQVEYICDDIQDLLKLVDKPIMLVGIGYGNDKVSAHRHHIDKNLKWVVSPRTPPITFKVWE